MAEKRSYLGSHPCKKKATYLYTFLPVCDEHKSLLQKIIERNGHPAEYVDAQFTAIKVKKRAQHRVQADVLPRSV